jgi:hypothetical protein
MRRLTRRWLLAAAFVLPGSPAGAQDLLGLYQNSVSKRPFVTFFARDDTSTGHAFVGTGVELDNGLLFYEGLFGYYPTGSGKSQVKALWRIDGVITSTWADLNPSITYRVPLTDDQKQKALAVLARWDANDPGYSLLGLNGKNCSVLAKEVAQAVDLKVPSADPGATFPASYIAKLRDANR